MVFNVDLLREGCVCVARVTLSKSGLIGHFSSLSWCGYVAVSKILSLVPVCSILIIFNVRKYENIEDVT